MPYHLHVTVVCLSGWLTVFCFGFMVQLALPPIVHPRTMQTSWIRVSRGKMSSRDRYRNTAFPIWTLIYTSMSIKLKTISGVWPKSDFHSNDHFYKNRSNMMPYLHLFSFRLTFSLILCALYELNKKSAPPDVVIISFNTLYSNLLQMLALPSTKGLHDLNLVK